MVTSRRDLLRMLWRPVSAPFTAPPIQLDTTTCLGWRRTVCTLCGDVCTLQAIRTQAMLRPHIDTKVCTLCGDCLPVCPVAAITITASSPSGGPTWE